MMMKRGILAIALAACAALVVAACDAVAPLVAAARSVGARFKAWALDGLALAASDSTAEPARPVVLVRAAAFVLRIIKRERPELTASWRMCPSG